MGGFDDLLEEIEGTGWYQKRITYLILCPIFFLMPFAFLNQVFALHIPSNYQTIMFSHNLQSMMLCIISAHWCTPPEFMQPDDLNMTLDQWKATFLPMALGPDYQPRPSGCVMYNVTEETLPYFLNGQMPDNMTTTVACTELDGYTYYTEDMLNTAVSDNDWVCDYAKRATDLFTLGAVGLIVGTFFFSLIADYKGRKLSFFLSTAFMIILSICTIWASHVYPAYLTLKILSFACMLPLFQSPLAITTEISSIKGRGLVIGWACIAWSVGNCAMPFVAWLIKRWKILRVVCVIPMAFIFVCWKIIPESPRWLVSKNRVQEAYNIMEVIAKKNKTVLPDDAEEKLRELGEDTSEKSYGYLSLFSSKNLAWRTVCVTIAFTSSAFVYYQLVINIGNMAGNIFLNLFLLGLVEGPGCAVGVILADKIGRRWTHTILLAINSALFFILMWVVYNPALKNLVIALCMIIKLSISGTFVVAYVQAMEIFPTCIRQTGIGFATLISQTISIGGPYVIYLGMHDLKLPYMVMFIICLIGCVCVMCLPETLGCKLPETIAEASEFGKGDPFFSFLPHGRPKKEKKDKKKKEVSFHFHALLFNREKIRSESLRRSLFSMNVQRTPINVTTSAPTPFLVLISGWFYYPAGLFNEKIQI